MLSNPVQPRVVDNDRDEITVTLDGREIRGWSYECEAEHRTKMLAAREFCEGWFQASKQAAPIGEISKIEVLALKKLAVICGALATSLENESAAREQRALTSVLVDVVRRTEGTQKENAA